jgi:hypothetical protein
VTGRRPPDNKLADKASDPSPKSQAEQQLHRRWTEAVASARCRQPIDARDGAARHTIAPLMPYDISNIVNQLESVADDWRDSHNANGYVEHYDVMRLITRARSAIERLAPPGSPYIEDARTAVKEHEQASDSWIAERLVAIVDALVADYRTGGLLAIAEIVHADLFDDFFQMAEDLLRNGYIGPAAVIAGSVLEEHVRKLAGKVGLPLSDDRGRAMGADQLAIGLRKSGTITEVQRKSLVAWYAIRNEAAHNVEPKIDPGELERTIDGVRSFVANHPA